MALGREGLRRMGEEDLARQEALIVTAIVASGDGAAQAEGVLRPRKPNVTGGSEPIDLARDVGDMLGRSAERGLRQLDRNNAGRRRGALIGSPSGPDSVRGGAG